MNGFRDRIPLTWGVIGFGIVKRIHEGEVGWVGSRSRTRENVDLNALKSRTVRRDEKSKLNGRWSSLSTSKTSILSTH